jgi:hypothetical protein
VSVYVAYLAYWGVWLIASKNYTSLLTYAITAMYAGTPILQ